jgi:hypothetical protein
MEFKIQKLDLSNYKQGYSSIPNTICTNRDLSDKQARLLIFLMSHKDGFKINENFIAKGLKLNWIRVSKNFNFLIENEFIYIKNGILLFNLERLSIEKNLRKKDSTKQTSTKQTIKSSTKQTIGVVQNELFNGTKQTIINGTKQTINNNNTIIENNNSKIIGSQGFSLNFSEDENKFFETLFSIFLKNYSGLELDNFKNVLYDTFNIILNKLSQENNHINRLKIIEDDDHFKNLKNSLESYYSNDDNTYLARLNLIIKSFQVIEVN